MNGEIAVEVLSARLDSDPRVDQSVLRREAMRHAAGLGFTGNLISRLERVGEERFFYSHIFSMARAARLSGVGLPTDLAAVHQETTSYYDQDREGQFVLGPTMIGVRLAQGDEVLAVFDASMVAETNSLGRYFGDVYLNDISREGLVVAKKYGCQLAVAGSGDEWVVLGGMPKEEVRKMEEEIREKVRSNVRHLVAFQMGTGEGRNFLPGDVVFHPPEAGRWGKVEIPNRPFPVGGEKRFRQLHSEYWDDKIGMFFDSLADPEKWAVISMGERTMMHNMLQKFFDKADGGRVAVYRWAPDCLRHLVEGGDGRYYSLKVDFPGVSKEANMKGYEFGDWALTRMAKGVVEEIRKVYQGDIRVLFEDGMTFYLPGGSMEVEEMVLLTKAVEKAFWKVEEGLFFFAVADFVYHDLSVDPGQFYKDQDKLRERDFKGGFEGMRGFFQEDHEDQEEDEIAWLALSRLIAPYLDGVTRRGPKRFWDYMSRFSNRSVQEVSQLFADFRNGDFYYFDETKDQRLLNVTKLREFKEFVRERVLTKGLE